MLPYYITFHRIIIIVSFLQKKVYYQLVQTGERVSLASLRAQSFLFIALNFQNEIANWRPRFKFKVASQVQGSFCLIVINLYIVVTSRHCGVWLR